jgi:hypothetical protein
VVESQTAGGSVMVASVTSEQDGWVVAHTEKNGEVGAIIAARRINAGTTQNVEIDLLGAQTQAGNNYYVVLYNDDGDKKFDYKKDFPLKDAQGNVIATKFIVEGEVMGDITEWKTYTNTEYGFELKYPTFNKETKIITENDFIYFKHYADNYPNDYSDTFGIGIHANIQKLSFEDWLTKNVDSKGTLVKHNVFLVDTKLSTEKRITYRFSGSTPEDFEFQTLPLYFVVNPTNKLILAVNLSQDDDLDKYGYNGPERTSLLEEIIRTLRFTK